jgi:hypothetical protein
MKETARRIKRRWFIERQNGIDMRSQKGRGFEIWVLCCGHSCLSMAAA